MVTHNFIGDPQIFSCPRAPRDLDPQIPGKARWWNGLEKA